MSFSGTSGGRGLKVNWLIQVHLKNGRYIYSGGYSGPYWLVATVLLARVCVTTAFTDSIQYIDCPRISPAKVPFRGASSPHQFVVIGTIWVHTPNGILMGSWLLTVTWPLLQSSRSWSTDTQTTSVTVWQSVALMQQPDTELFLTGHMLGLILGCYFIQVGRWRWWEIWERQCLPWWLYFLQVYTKDQ